MAGNALTFEDYVSVFERAAREKEQRKQAMDSIVDLCIERAVLRRALRGMLAAVDVEPRTRGPIAAALVALNYAGIQEDTTS